MTAFSSGDTAIYGFKAPKNTQFSIFLANKVGKLLELIEVLEGQALDIAGLSVVDSADHAVVRLLTSRAELTQRILERHNFPFSQSDVLVVELCNDQSMVQLCTVLLAAEINIQYAYPLLVHPHGNPAIAIHCDDYILAGQILRRKLFCLLAENDLGDNINPGNYDNMNN